MIRIDRAPGYCMQCKRTTLHMQSVQGANHIFGLWVFVWTALAFTVSVTETDWYCSQCGTQWKRPPPEPILADTVEELINHSRDDLG